MINPIIDNRIVSNKTFAVRFLSFIKAVHVNDPGSEEEKEMLINVGHQLLKYQCVTATDVQEISYLKMNSVYNENIQPLFITEDGVKIMEGMDVLLYSCMKISRVGNQILEYETKYYDKDNIRINDKRVYFVDRQKCVDYIDYNTPIYSKKDVDIILLNK